MFQKDISVSLRALIGHRISRDLKNPCGHHTTVITAITFFFSFPLFQTSFLLSLSCTPLLNQFFLKPFFVQIISKHKQLWFLLVYRTKSRVLVLAFKILYSLYNNFFSLPREQKFFLSHLQCATDISISGPEKFSPLYSASKFKWFSPWRLPHILLLFKFMLEFSIFSSPLIIYVCCLYKQMQLSSNEMISWAKEYIL